MFFEAMQAYYAPTVALVFFAFLLATNQLMSRREKGLFLVELGVVALMICTTWVDRCISAITIGNWWKLRFFTSALQFAGAPLSPLTLLMIYRRDQKGRDWLFVLPAIFTAMLSMSSIWTGWVLQVQPGNIYSRGPLFLLPFIVSALYIVFILQAVAGQPTPGRQVESVFLIFAGLTIAGACVLEIVFVIRYMIWSTTVAMLMLYFLLITVLKVLYDSQTGVYSRLAYTKWVESAHAGQVTTLAMIDLNGLKEINDCYGHKAGDSAITQVSCALMGISMRGRKLYRYGGDEFVITVKGLCGPALTQQLQRLATNCGSVNGTALSFAYGVVEHRGGDLLRTIDEMDRCMYTKKEEMKGQEA